jgi:hypothetical protein
MAAAEEEEEEAEDRRARVETSPFFVCFPMRCLAACAWLWLRADSGCAWRTATALARIAS